MKDVVYKLVKEPTVLGKPKSNKKVIPACERIIRLVDDVVIHRPGKDQDGEAKRRTICICPGESSIFLEDHDNKNRSKSEIEYIKVQGLYYVVPEDRPDIMEFLKLSKKSNPDKYRKASLVKLEPGKTAKEEFEKIKIYTQVSAMITEDGNWKKVKAYALSKGFFTKEQIDDYGKEVVQSTVLRHVNLPNAKEVLEELNSEVMQVKGEMIEARDAGKFVVNTRSKTITYADGGAIITTYNGIDPIGELAKFVLRPENANHYQYLTSGKNDKPEVKAVSSADEIKSLSVEEAVNKAFRMNIFEKKEKGFRFNGVNVGGDKTAVVSHFADRPEKVKELKARILLESE